ncbi:MAG: response regulator [Planctomycetes bacterium]|nr:response regulator [Planctomycetota bacterium]
MSTEAGRVLIVDDDEDSRELLARLLHEQGLKVSVAREGRTALKMLVEGNFDLLLLDIVMPEMDGYHVLGYLKSDESLRDLPVVVISAVSELDSIIRCIEVGADDYLLKPYNPVLLKARIDACLEKKRLRDCEQVYHSRLREEQKRSEHLLLNILPKPIARRLLSEEAGIVDAYEEVTVLFADIAGFTGLAMRKSPQDLVAILNEVFSLFDGLTERHGLEKIKTIGDAYMVAAGLPVPRTKHTEAMVEMALNVQEALTTRPIGGEPIRVRIGIHSGPVIAGVIGTKKFSYDLWGETVNIASRLESHGRPGMIHVSGSVREKLGDRYTYVDRDLRALRGVGEMETCFLTGRRAAPAPVHPRAVGERA